ncbi:MAG: dynamin family protein [Hyphomicrobiaceae bacterium]
MTDIDRDDHVDRDNGDASPIVDSNMRGEAKRAIARLRALSARRPCVVLLGESNAGKTTLANGLLQDAALPTSVMSNTRRPILLRYGSTICVTAITDAGLRIPAANAADIQHHAIKYLEVLLPDPSLEAFDLLDTPGGAGAEEAEHILGRLTPHIPVWCTTATQAWKESERRRWLEQAPRFRRNGILAVTRLDLIGDQRLIARLFSRLDDAAGGYFHAIIGSRDVQGRAHEIKAIINVLAVSLEEHRRQTIGRLCDRIQQYGKEQE